jgi:hypothetical protein
MKRLPMSPILMALLLSAVGLACGFLSWLPWNSPSDVQASTPVDIAIDMDVTGNDARLTGGADIQNCGEIDSSGTNTIVLDVVLSPPGIDAADGIGGYQFDLNYDPTVVSVTAEDINFLLAQASGSHLYWLSNSVPDSDGHFTSAAADLGSAWQPEPTGVSEVGPGVIARITLTGVARGTTPLTLTYHTYHAENPGAILVAADGNQIPIDEVFNATVSVDEPCVFTTPTPTPAPIPTPRPTRTPTATPTPKTPVDIAIDMDVTGNDARLSGGADIQNCGEIDSSGTNTIDIDVLLPPPGIDAADGIRAYQFDLNYDPTVVNVTAEDNNFLLVQASGSRLFSTPDPLPSSDGHFTSIAGDSSSAWQPEPTGASEIGPGVIARLTLRGVAQGTTPLTLTYNAGNDPPGLMAADAWGIPIDEVFNATVSVDEPCVFTTPTSTSMPTPTPDPPDPAAAAAVTAPGATPTPMPAVLGAVQLPETGGEPAMASVSAGHGWSPVTLAAVALGVLTLAASGLYVVKLRRG